MKLGTHYHPEQWPRAQWEQDLEQMRALGLQQAHVGKFAWATIEPRQGESHLDWLLDFLNLAQQRGLGIVLVTPAAAPPRWLGEQHADAQASDAGGRRFYSPHSDAVRQAVTRLIQTMVNTLSDHPAVVGWQVGTGCATPLHPSSRDEQAFGRWLAQRYQSVDALNKAWGCERGHLTYADFSHVRLPTLNELQDRNPHAHLDAARFWSAAWGDLARLQTRIIQPRLGERFVIVQCATEDWTCNPVDAADDGVMLGWDNFPVAGHAAQTAGEAHRLGDPNAIGLCNAVFASFGGKWGQTELQIGQLSREELPALPYPGATRLWLWTALAHGASFAAASRFRKSLAGPGLFDDALVRADGVNDTAAGRQFAQVASEFKRLDPAKLEQSEGGAPNAHVGMIFDAEQFWSFRASSHAARWNQNAWLRRWYAAFARLGLGIVVLRPGMELPTPLPIVVAPALQMIDPRQVDQLASFASSGGHLVLTCRSGLLDRRGQHWEGPTAAPILPLIGASIEACDAPPPGAAGHAEFEDKRFAWDTWGDLLYADDDTKVLAKFSDQFYAGAACITRRKLGEGTVTYCGVHGEAALIDLLAQRTAERAGLKMLHLPPRVHVVRRGGYQFLLNYSDHSVEVPAGAQARFLVGGSRIDPAGVAVWQ